MSDTNGTTDLLARARELLAAITPGEWMYLEAGHPRGEYIIWTDNDSVCSRLRKRDAAFIAAAPALVRELLVLAEAQQAQLDAAQQEAEHQATLGARAEVYEACAEADNAALKARVSALERALLALVAEGSSTGYYTVAYTTFTWECTCEYCDWSWVRGQSERHADDCPIALARLALSALA